MSLICSANSHIYTDFKSFILKANETKDKDNYLWFISMIADITFHYLYVWSMITRRSIWVLLKGIDWVFRQLGLTRISGTFHMVFKDSFVNI